MDNVLSMAIVLAILAWVVSLNIAHSRTLEIHSSWLMMCSPVDGQQFAVGVNATTNKLLIGSKSGRLRTNQIVNNEPEGNGFRITAIGADYSGNSRVIEAFFSANGGSLSVIDRGDPPIFCGPDFAASND